MAFNDFIIKRNDRQPTMTATLKDADGNAVDLTGATVLFKLRLVGSTTLKVSATAVVDPDQVNNKGKVSYAWAAVDTDAAGIYEAEFQATISGLIQTFPNSQHLVVNIVEDL